MTDATFTFRLERSLKVAFAAMAGQQDLSAAQLLRKMMREAVSRRQEEAAHEQWLQSEIGDAMRDDDQHSGRLSNDMIDEQWRREKDEISGRDEP